LASESKASNEAPQSPTVLVSCCWNETLMPLNVWVWSTMNTTSMYSCLELISRERRDAHSPHGEGSSKTHAADYRKHVEHAGLFLLTSGSI